MGRGGERLAGGYTTVTTARASVKLIGMNSIANVCPDKLCCWGKIGLEILWSVMGRILFFQFFGACRIVEYSLFTGKCWRSLWFRRIEGISWLLELGVGGVRNMGIRNRSMGGIVNMLIAGGESVKV